MIRQKPRVVLNVAHSLISHLSPFLRQIDFALDWMHVEAGRAVYRYILCEFIMMCLYSSSSFFKLLPFSTVYDYIDKQEFHAQPARTEEVLNLEQLSHTRE